MKRKLALSFLSFAVAFLLSVVVFPQLAAKSNLNSTHSEPLAITQNKVSRFLQQNSENRRVKLNKLEKRPPHSGPRSFIDPSDEYVTKSENMSLAGLPEDFQIAWLRYVKASRESLDLISHLKSLPEKAVFDDEEKDQAEIRFAAEENAWENVLSVAKKYDVDANK